MLEARLVLEPDPQRGPTVLGRALVAQQDRFGRIEGEVDRRGRDNGGQHIRRRRSSGDQIARVRPAVGHPARDRRGHARELQVEPRLTHGRIGRRLRRLGGLQIGAAQVHRSLGQEALVEQGRGALELGARQVGLGLGLGDLGLRGGHSGLRLARIQGEHQLPLTDIVPVLEMHRLDIAADPRTNLDGLRRLEPARELVPVHHLADQRLGDGDLRRRRRALLSL